MLTAHTVTVMNSAAFRGRQTGVLIDRCLVTQVLPWFCGVPGSCPISRLSIFKAERSYWWPGVWDSQELKDCLPVWAQDCFHGNTLQDPMTLDGDIRNRRQPLWRNKKYTNSWGIKPPPCCSLLWLPHPSSGTLGGRALWWPACMRRRRCQRSWGQSLAHRLWCRGRRHNEWQTPPHWVTRRHKTPPPDRLKQEVNRKQWQGPPELYIWPFKSWIIIKPQEGQVHH